MASESGGVHGQTHMKPALLGVSGGGEGQVPIANTEAGPSPHFAFSWVTGDTVIYLLVTIMFHLIISIRFTSASQVSRARFLMPTKTTS